MSLLVDKDRVTDYIPQRFSMVMIDGIKKYDSNKIQTTLKVEEENIFLSEGVLSESGMLENIAQSAAAMSGLKCKEDGKPILLGFIAGISKVKHIKSPEVGAQLETTVELQREVIGITLISGVCRSEGEDLLSCEMKIFIDEEK